MFRSVGTLNLYRSASDLGDVESSVIGFLHIATGPRSNPCRYPIFS